MAGTVVLDLVDGLGVYGPKLMVGLGAEVIRVEPPAGSVQRGFAPLYRAVGGEEGSASLYFLHYNSGKKGITLDYTKAEGREVLLRLLANVDVVFDNGQLDRLGLAPETLASSSSVVVVSITPFGLRSARSDWLGEDLICQAMSGMIALYGYRDERPARFGPEQASEMSGLAAALGAVVALYGARRDGKGEFVDIAMERVGCLVTLQMSNASMYRQFGFRHLRDERSAGLPSILMQASDGFVQLRMWQNVSATRQMLDEHGAGEGLADVRRDLKPAELAADPRLRAAVQAFVAGHTRAELMEIVPLYGIDGLPVHDVEDLVRDLFLQARSFFAEVELPEAARSFLDMGAVARFSASPWRLARRPPLLGEHSEEVLGRLGLDRTDIERLRAEGVV